MRITAKQKEFLKAHARYLDEAVVVGGMELTDGQARAVRKALEKEELIKVRLTGARGPDKRTLAAAIAQRLSAELIGIQGHVIILFRQKEEGSKFILPAADSL